MSRLAEFKFARRHKRQFSQFYAALSNAFIPIRRIFIKNSSYFLKMEQYYILVLLLYKMQKVGCVCWFHDRY